MESCFLQVDFEIICHGALFPKSSLFGIRKSFDFVRLSSHTFFLID